MAMELFHKLTCIRFRPVEWWEWIFNPYRMQIGALLAGCWCSKHNNAATVNIGPGCDRVSTIVHELTHGVGAAHEHQLSYREEALRVDEKAMSESHKSEFVRYGAPRTAPLDLRSIMLYATWVFSHDPHILPVIHAKNPLNIRLIDKPRYSFSFLDAKRLNENYECHKKCDKPLKCLNGGYYGKSQGPDSCKCVCNYSFYGDHCEKTKHLPITFPPGTPASVIDDQLLYGTFQCGGVVVATEETIRNPDFGARKMAPDHLNCGWLIIAPEGKRVSVTFTEWDFTPAERIEGIYVCLDERVEIRRKKNIYKTVYHCGTHLRGETLESEGRTFYILMVGYGDHAKGSKGFEAQISYV